MSLELASLLPPGHQRLNSRCSGPVDFFNVSDSNSNNPKSSNVKLPS